MPKEPTEQTNLRLAVAIKARAKAAAEAEAEISEAHALGSNRDQRMVTRYGVKAAPWLESLGWQKQGRKWYRNEGLGC